MKSTTRKSYSLGIMLPLTSLVCGCSDQMGDVGSPSEKIARTSEASLTRAISSTPSFFKGADFSYANNTVRLRLWHNPTWTKYQCQLWKKHQDSTPCCNFTWDARETVPVSERKYGDDRLYEIKASATEQTISCTLN